MDLFFVLSALLAFYIAWSIGANDETMAVVAGSGFTSIGIAVAIGALMDFLGAVVASEAVEKTMGVSLLAFTPTDKDFFIILFATATWLVIASYRGWPISTTHSAVGAALGIALLRRGLEGVNAGVVWKILSGWVFSPIFGLLGSFILYKVFEHLYLKRSSSRGIVLDLKVAKACSIALVAWAAATSFFRGGNDAANATAFLLRIYPYPLYVRLLGGVGIALGLIILGRRVVKNVGTQLVVLDPATGLTVQLSTALTLAFGTLMGFPLSGTHVLVAALAGIGLAKRSWINLANLKEILLTWVITFPSAAALAAVLGLLI